MAGWTDNFNPADLYRMVLYPPGHILVDRDENEAQQILKYYLRKAIKELNGMGKIIHSPPAIGLFLTILL